MDETSQDRILDWSDVQNQAPAFEFAAPDRFSLRSLLFPCLFAAYCCVNSHPPQPLNPVHRRPGGLDAADLFDEIGGGFER
jgi:hypothetical protein